MNLETKTKDKVSNSSSSKKKVRIGSRVPEGNREWLKRHGILTDFPPPPKSSFSPVKKFFSRYEKSILIAVAFFISILPLVWFQQQQGLFNQIQSEQARVKSLQASNYHMRGSFEKLATVNTVQQAEINRMASQMREMTRRFNSEIGDFQKGEAIYDAIQRIYDSEMSRMDEQYDFEIESLRRQIQDKDQMISSLETSLQSMDGVVVRAEPIVEKTAKGMTNASIAAVNPDFQFVVVDVGELKGAKMSQMVELYHQGSLIGYGQIEKVYPDYSGVKVFSEEAMKRLEKGDSVFLHQISGL